MMSLTPVSEILLNKLYCMLSTPEAAVLCLQILLQLFYLQWLMLDEKKM